MHNDFNFVAPVYDQLARLIFGKAIQESQSWLLPFIPENATVLIIGGGTGWVLIEMLQKTKAREIVYLEASEKMLQISRKRYDKSPKNPGTKLEFRLGTEDEIKDKETFDVIFTGFLLDLFKPAALNQLIQKLTGALNENGTWLVTDFDVKNAVKFWQKALLKTMVQFFKVTANLQADSIPDVPAALAATSLSEIQNQHFFHRLIFSAVYRKN